MFGKQCKCDWVAKVVCLIQILLTFGGCCNSFFWDIWLKILTLPNFDMLFQLVLTKFFKSELFSCLPKVDHVITVMQRTYSTPTVITRLNMNYFLMQPPHKVDNHSHIVEHHRKMLSVIMYSLPDSGLVWSKEYDISSRTHALSKPIHLEILKECGSVMCGCGWLDQLWMC